LLPEQEIQHTINSSPTISLTHYDASLLMSKELLADAINEIVSVNNRQKINSLLQKFDSEATKAHHVMQQAHQDMIIEHTECVEAIQHVLSGHGNIDMDDNDKIPDEEKDSDEQVANENVQETTNEEPEAPTQRDQVHNNSNMDEQEVPDARTNAAMDDPGQLTNELTMNWKLNAGNVVQSLHDQMCWQPPRCHRHVAELFLLLYSDLYFTNYSMFNH
jgi:hypothetical protein